MRTKSYTQITENWSSPNVNGHILFTADATAARTGAIRLYDPYGQNIDPVSGTFADLPLPATAEGGMDFGWLGQHTAPIEHRHLSGDGTPWMGPGDLAPARRSAVTRDEGWVGSRATASGNPQPSRASTRHRGENPRDHIVISLPPETVHRRSRPRIRAPPHADAQDVRWPHRCWPGDLPHTIRRPSHGTFHDRDVATAG